MKPRDKSRILRYTSSLTEFWEGNELAAILSGLIDVVDGQLSRLLKVEPSWLRVDSRGLVFLEYSNHSDNIMMQ